jgi:hypothetical protein
MSFNRFTDKLRDAVQEAIENGVTPEKFVKHAEDAWTEVLRGMEQSARYGFRQIREKRP